MSPTATALAVEDHATRERRVPPRHACCGFIDPVLLVTLHPEDDRTIRRMLTKLGYTVLSALSGERAVRIAERHAGFLGLLLTDLNLPGMSGLTLADFVALHQPDVPTLVMCDRPSDVDELQARQLRYTPYLQKPFTEDAFMRGLHSATEIQHSPELRLVMRDGQPVSPNRSSLYTTRRRAIRQTGPRLRGLAM